MKTLDLSAVRTAALAILLALLPIAVNAQTPPGTQWTMLGVYTTTINDASHDADNVNALNGLPPNQVINGNCTPEAPYIRINGQWFLQSNLTIYVQSGCKVVCVLSFTTTGPGCVTQRMLGTATLDTVFIDGLYLVTKIQLFSKAKPFVSPPII